MLYPFQQDILKATKQKNRVAYFLDMGLGKTFVGAKKLVELNSSVNLLICQKSKIDDWKEHFREYYPVIKTYDMTNGKSFGAFFKDSTGMKLGIINYELAWRRQKLLELQNFTLMLDESSLIQNRKAKQSKFIMKLKAQNVILLSGTPCSGKFENLWTQSRLLGWEITEEIFLAHYVNFKLIKIGRAYHKTVDMSNPYKNVDRLKNKLRSYGAVFMKTEEVMDLPEQNFNMVKCPVSKDYKEFKKDRVIEVNGTELVGDTTLTLMLRLRQLCGQYSKSKIEAFIDLLESTNDRLIVFYNFNEELAVLDHIAKGCGKPTSYVNGKHKDLKNYEEMSDSVTFIQYQAGSMGLNLQKANKVIYFTLPLRSELFEQSKKRIHRIGQKNTCFYYVMICTGSIEEKIYKTLQMRKDFTDELFKQEVLNV